MRAFSLSRLMAAIFGGWQFWLEIKGTYQSISNSFFLSLFILLLFYFGGFHHREKEGGKKNSFQ